MIVINANKNSKNGKIDPSDISKESSIVFAGEYVDKSFVEVTSDDLVKEQCDGNICVSITKIKCNKTMGSIYYKITNRGNSNISGYYKLSIGKKDIYLKYDNLGVNESFETTHSYTNADLRKVSSFTIKLLDESYKKRYK